VAETPHELELNAFPQMASWWKPPGMGAVGASGETRTLTLLPATDFESAASTDSATEAMAAEYREALAPGQSRCVVSATLFR
jgi:hypothetical protein